MPFKDFDLVDIRTWSQDEKGISQPEKGFACQVEAGRQSGRTLRPTVPLVTWPTRTPIPDTPASAQPEGEFTHGH